MLSSILETSQCFFSEMKDDIFDSKENSRQPTSPEDTESGVSWSCSFEKSADRAQAYCYVD